MPRFFIENVPSDSEIITITGQDANHIIKSLRMKIGEEVTVCGGQGFDFICSIAEISDGTVLLNVNDKKNTDSEPSVRITLYQGNPKGDKMELIIEKSIELGVTEIVPVLMQRSVARPDAKSAAKKHERMNKIALSAAKQCGRGIIPNVGEMLTFKQMLQKLSEHQAVIFFYECGGEPLTKVIDGIKSESLTDVAIVIGPEGGFDLGEAQQLRDAGAFTATLGRRILRTETAPLAAISAIMFATGNMD